MKEELVTVADCFTLMRLFLVPVFISAFLFERPNLALGSFAVAGFTDLIDGSIARFLKQPSRLGAFLDPIADKLLLESAFICLTFAHILPLWFLLIALTRDVMILCGIYYLHRIKAAVNYKAVYASKCATLFQLTTTVLALLLYRSSAGVESLLYNWMYFFLLLSTILIMVSGIQYVSIGFRVLRKRSTSS